MNNKKRVCIDVGGTFTDCLVMDETGLLQKFKASTTPSDPSIGLMNTLKKAARHYGADIGEFLSQIEVLVHGTTLATNILINERGTKAGMITTKGFRDSIEMRRGIKPIDVSRLERWDEIFPSLKQVKGIMIDGEVYHMPWDWGNETILYRADLVDIEAESYSLLLDE